MYTLEEKIVGRFTVNLHHDEDVTAWDDVLCDEPIMVVDKGRYDRFEFLFDGTKKIPSGDAIYFQIDDADWDEVLSSVYGLDWEVLNDGRIRVDAYTLWNRPRYFKTMESAAKRVLKDETGIDLDDLRLERISTRDSEVLLVWAQSELDRYAGTKGAKAPVETVRSYLDGEVYGWTVEDEDGDILESCCGYIGDASYCMAEGESFALHLESKELTKDASGIEASRPDLYEEA